MVLRRLAGRTENSAPVMTLVSQFGGGKTHTLTALFHLAKHSQKVSKVQRLPAFCHRLDSAMFQAQRLRFCGKRLGPGRGTGNAMDRCRPSTRR